LFIIFQSMISICYVQSIIPVYVPFKACSYRPYSITILFIECTKHDISICNVQSSFLPSHSTYLLSHIACSYHINLEPILPLSRCSFKVSNIISVSDIHLRLIKAFHQEIFFCTQKSSLPPRNILLHPKIKAFKISNKHHFIYYISVSNFPN
jgi:hypothetical protein